MASTGEAYGLFWNSEHGDRTYDASSFEYWLKKFFTSGVFNGDLQVVATSSMIVRVDPGYANVDGKVKFLNSALNIVLDAANSTRPRIDTIVVTRDNVNREIRFEKVTGQYSTGEPQPTTPIRNTEIYQLVLAQIYVAAGVTSIIQANISDTRSNPDLCGWITGTVNEMDFSQFAAQFASYYEDFVDTNQADFESWFNQMKDQLSTDAAGHLQAQINGINENIDTVENDIDGINDHLTTTDSDIGNLQTDVAKKLYQYAHGSSQWDTTPTANSEKPVTSGGVKDQFDLVTNEFSDINNILGAKNILPNGASTVTTNGITFTVNSNGTVKATGTATADAILVLASSFYVGNGKKVILSGCPSGGSTSKYYLQMTNANGTTGKGNDIGSGVTITADADNLGCRIIIKKNQALGTTGITFSPMVRPANIRNASYVPYAMTNRELSSQISNLSQKYGIISYSQKVTLLTADGINDFYSILPVAKNHLQAWINNRSSDELFHIDSTWMAGMTILNPSSTLHNKNSQVSAIDFVSTVITGNHLLVADCSGFNHYWKYENNAFYDMNSIVPPLGQTIEVLVTIYKKG